MVDEIDNSRRAFFRRAAGKAAGHAVDEVEARVEARAAQWIRPPWALPELEFLLACTRCGDCLPACPEHLIFGLPGSYGLDVASTPALDLLNKACLLCEGWPCVAACETGALRLPEEAPESPPPLPRLARASIDTSSCLPYLGPECGACEGSCPVPGALTWEMTRPSIEMALCVGCGQCRQACITDPKAVRLVSLYAKNS